MAQNNDLLYNAALVGYTAGQNQSKGVVNTTASEYADVVAEAVFFAKEVDSLIANDSSISAGGGTAILPTTPTQQASQICKFAAVAEFSRAAAAGRQTVGGSAESYAGLAAGVVAAYTEAVTNMILP